MARPGLHISEVKQACEILAAQGRHPSVDAVRAALGNRGSKTTIHRLLKECAPSGATSPPAPADTVRQMVDALAVQLHADTDARIARLRAEHADILGQQAARIDALNHQVHALSLRLRQMARRDADDDLPALGRGFGKAAHDLTDNNRAGVAGFSKFDSFFSNRSASTGGEQQGQADTIFWRI